MLYVNEIFFTGLFFILFLIIISIFGFLLIFLFYRDIIERSFLVIVGISLGCGIVFYIFYSYLIEIFLFFNFFTILLPIIIFDIVGLIYLINCDLKIKEKLNYKYIKQKIIKNRKEIILSLIIFIVIFYFQLYIQYDKIVRFKSQFASDSFTWCRLVMYLLDYGHLEYSEVGFYTAGYIFVNGGMNLFCPNYRFIYFFHKFVPIFYMSLIIFIGFIISRILFKRIFLTFLTMFGFLTLNYFNYRFLIPLPSVAATISFFIFSITLIDSKIPFYIRGILLAGPILFHPLYGTIGFGIFFIYIIQLFLTLILKRKESKKEIYKFLKQNIYTIVIFIGVLIPTLINLTLNYPIWYQRYWNTLFPPTISVIKLSSISNVDSFPVLCIGNFNFEGLVSSLEIIIKHIWIGNPLIFFILIYFFLRIKKKNYKNFKNFIEFVKVSIIISFLFYFMYFLINWFFPLAILDNLKYCFDVFKLRIFEFSAGFIILLFVFTVNDIYNLFSKATLKLKNKFPKYKKFLRGNNLNNFKEKIFHIIKSPWKIETIIILIALCFSFNLYKKNNFYYYCYEYYDDNFVEMILTIGDSEPIGSNINTTILFPSIENKIILNLLYRYNYEFISFEQNYSELVTLIISKNASYIILPIKEIPEETVRSFVFSYEIFYGYSKYIVIKIK